MGGWQGWERNKRRGKKPKCIIYMENVVNEETMLTQREGIIKKARKNTYGLDIKYFNKSKYNFISMDRVLKI